MKKLLSVFLVALSVNAYSQGVVTAKDIKIDFSGFVRNDFIYDTRKNVDALDHLLEFYPKAPDLDSNGEDLNAKSSAQFLNIFTRFGTRLSGLKIGETEVGAYIEVDFTGGTATNSLRFRHAYTQFGWTRSNLLVGRTWHPVFIEKVFPTTLNENTGIPFQAFNRSPQIRYTHQLTDNLDFIAAAIYQFKFASSGPNGKTYQYQRDAVIPNLHAQLQYYNANWVAGAAFDWKTIQPRTFTDGTGGRFKTSEKISSVLAIAYVKYTKEKLTVKAKTAYGQNSSESFLPGGYGVSSIDSETGAETYTPSNNIYNWINIVYGAAWKVGFFAGHQKNLGLSENPVGPVYGFATDVDMMYRVSPHLMYNYRNFMFGIELSWTTAAYGDMDFNDLGKIKNTENVTNFRNMISIAYKF